MVTGRRSGEVKFFAVSTRIAVLSPEYLPKKSKNFFGSA
ncbi:hypothetical protein DCCM_1982 [Desulfocucumis palustris]|uniref:Uncharacterized protein n=1 Tax=Desulfocucumis palustris TaxID=1898651 RepID=A0A2L2X9L3_9FIRM|nr:hypothetical protein DCCM_1982 [Desulfocucumis palustris]